MLRYVVCAQSEDVATIANRPMGVAIPAAVTIRDVATIRPAGAASSAVPSRCLRVAGRVPL